MKKQSSNQNKKLMQVWLTLSIAVLLCTTFFLVESSPTKATGDDLASAPNVVFTNPAPITIPAQGAANPYPSSIAVSGLTGTIPSTPSGIRVTINGLSHSYTSDIGMVLVGPTGAGLLLQLCATDLENGSISSNVTYSISDAGATRMPDSSGLVTGTTYKPTSYCETQSGGVVNFPAPGPGTNYNNSGPGAGGTATFASTFGGTNPNGTWNLFVADFFAGDSGSISGGWALDITTGGGTPTPTATPTASPTPTPATCRIQRRSDFNGDGRTDFAVFRPASGTWFVLPNGTNSASGTQFGIAGDRLQPADYDGDGRTDFAVYRSGVWFISRSSDSSVLGYQFGASTDIPVAGDYTGDGRADLAVYRPASGVWYILRSENSTAYGVQWGGAASDLPIVGDFDGDCRMDLTVRRTTNDIVPGATQFFISGSTIGATSVRWGRDDMPTAIGDYDGDGRSDVGVIETRNGLLLWYVIRAVGNTVIVNGTQFGQTGDVVTAGDYDGDARTDLSVFRPSNGFFYYRTVLNATQFAQPFGAASDTPIARWSQYPLP